MSVSYILDRKEIFVLSSLLGVSVAELDKFCMVTENHTEDYKILTSLENKSFVVIKAEREISVSPVFRYLFRKMEMAEKYIDFYNDNCIIYCCEDIFISVCVDRHNSGNIIVTPLQDEQQMKEFTENENMTEFITKEILDKGDLIF